MQPDVRRRVELMETKVKWSRHAKEPDPSRSDEWIDERCWSESEGVQACRFFEVLPSLEFEFGGRYGDL